MAKNYIANLDPTWIADTTYDGGKIDQAHDAFDNMPSLWEVISGKEKLTHYYRNPADKSGARYYLLRSSEQGGRRLLLSTHGALFAHVTQNLYSRDRLRLMGFYFREQSAPSSRRAKGGFVQCGEDSESRSDIELEEQFYLPGNRQLAVYFEADAIRSAIVDSTLLQDMVRQKHPGSYDAQDAMTEELADRHVWGTISFKCLARFFHKNVTVHTSEAELLKTLFDVLPSERIALQDITQDDVMVVNIDPKDKKAITTQMDSAVLNDCPAVAKYRPARGYVAINFSTSDCGKTRTLHFHRSGNALFTDTVNHKQFVLGVDDDSYFGCELAEACGRQVTAYNALLSLAPHEARAHPKRKVSELKRMTLRQGEWFFVPYEDNNFPSPETHPLECLQIEEAFLQKSSGEDSDHILTGHTGEDYTALNESNHTVTLRYAWVHLPTGEIWVQHGTLTHSEGDHPDMEIPEDAGKEALHNLDTRAWKIVRNLAVRSFSEEGVD